MDTALNQDTTVGTAARDRYRQAEASLWQRSGLQPTDHHLDLARPATRVRVTEVGQGEPLLFVHGTAGLGPYWAPLLRELHGRRCLLLDRPGFGFSDPIDFAQHDYGTVTADVLRSVLDALGIERADVVGASIGDVWALRLAQRHPDRVRSVVLLGGGPLLAEVPVPRIIKVIRSPLGAIMVRLPENAARVRSIMRGGGHGPSIDSGLIPDEYFDWHVALMRATPSLRHERAMVRTIVQRDGFHPRLTFQPAELKGLPHPTLLVYGRGDPTAPIEVWERFVGLLPRGSLHLTDGGHLPWLDDPSGVASVVEEFLD